MASSPSARLNVTARWTSGVTARWTSGVTAWWTSGVTAWWTNCLPAVDMTSEPQQVEHHGPARRTDGNRDVGGDEDRAARVALTWLTEPGNRTVWAMVQQDGAPATLDRLVAGDFPDSRLRAAVTARAVVGDAHRIAEIALRQAERLAARVVVPSDAEWPARLSDLARLELDTGGRINQDTRPPLCFWVRGEGQLDEALERSVAIVGARAATSYGTHVATEMAYGLAGRDWTVLSGGAFGIDAAAHRGALAANGRTVAVLACGVDRPYPSGNSGLFEQIVDQGLLISEWPIGAEPLRHRFLIRNRVIAAATAGTVVVEAAARSGATQTMSRVLALSRPALVVPGPITSAMSVGCHEILRGNPYARVVTSADDVLEEVGRIGEYLVDPPRGPEDIRDSLDEESALILEALPYRRAATPEELAASAGLSLRTVLQRVSFLETAGLILVRENGVTLAPGRRRSGESDVDD
ncbi:DNA-processing protein DprA [Actinoplanes sp. GCM10030250]|uniref:DNA-processing protein DprA n=1 Tax=Actinoplanes sp. GCM10030250 TaxID=3273376 RepID=UPI0036196D73